MIRRAPYLPTSRPRACVLPCVLATSYRAADGSMLHRGESVALKQLPRQIHRNSFETSFSPGGGGG